MSESIKDLELEVIKEEENKKLTSEDIEKFYEIASKLLNQSDKLTTITIEGVSGIKTIIHKADEKTEQV